MFSLRFSVTLKMPSSHIGRYDATLRRRDSMVFPHMANRSPLNEAMLHMTNPAAMETVFPERMEPSQIIPSRSRNLFVFHHSTVILCRFEKLR